jgi:hypothetical protein
MCVCVCVCVYLLMFITPMTQYTNSDFDVDVLLINIY